MQAQTKCSTLNWPDLQYVRLRANVAPGTAHGHTVARSPSCTLLLQEVVECLCDLWENEDLWE